MHQCSFSIEINCCIILFLFGLVYYISCRASSFSMRASKFFASLSPRHNIFNVYVHMHISYIIDVR